MNINEYYSRQIILDDVGLEGQEALQLASVLVIGAGGLGCPALQYLSAAGVGRIGICDNDIVSITNLHRQVFFSHLDIGKSKASIAAKRCELLAPFSKVNCIEKRLTVSNIVEIAKDYDYLLDCTDNFSTKFLIHDYCLAYEKKLIQSSLYQFEGTVHHFDFLNNASPCFRCLYPEAPSDGCVGNCAQSGILGSVAGIMGAIQAHECLKSILKLECLKNGESLLFDLKDFSLFKSKWEVKEDCICSHKVEQRKLYFAETNKPKYSFELNIEDINVDDYVWVDLRSEDEISSDPLRISVKQLIHISDFSEEDYAHKKVMFFCQKGIRSLDFVSSLSSKSSVSPFSLAGGNLSLCPSKNV